MPVCVGCGLEVNPTSGVLETKLKPGGGLVCDGDGLSVTFPAAYSPTESPDDCNGFEVRGNGLYAPCPEATVGSHQWIGAEIAPLEVSTGGAGTFAWTSSVASITNTSCCEQQGRISARAGGVTLAMDNGFRGYADLQVNIDGAGWATAVPSTRIYCENSQGTPINIGLNNLLDENWIIFDAPPALGSTHSYAARIFLVVTAGTADASGVPAVEINWVAPQTGCC
jgi:hypothetical protein